jgi:hypothetical protein
MGMFRLWQPHEDAYMLGWNGVVAMHTLRKLEKQPIVVPVCFKIGALFDEYHIDEEKREHWPLAAHLKSLALASEGIHPILDMSQAKWFRVIDPIGANRRFIVHGDEIMARVVRDIWTEHAVRIEALPER